MLFSDVGVNILSHELLEKVTNCTQNYIDCKKFLQPLLVPDHFFSEAPENWKQIKNSVNLKGLLYVGLCFLDVYAFLDVDAF